MCIYIYICIHNYIIMILILMMIPTHDEPASCRGLLDVESLQDGRGLLFQCRRKQHATLRYNSTIVCDNPSRGPRYTLCICVYMYTCVCMYVCMYIYIYIYISRPWETSRPRFGKQSSAAAARVRGKHLSNTACLTQAFFKRVEGCSK